MTKTIHVTLDEPLLKAIDHLCSVRRTTRSAFIRDALKAELKRKTIRLEELRHAAGYARKPIAKGEFDVWVKEQTWDY